MALTSGTTVDFTLADVRRVGVGAQLPGRYWRVTTPLSTNIMNAWHNVTAAEAGALIKALSAESFIGLRNRAIIEVL